MKKIKNQVIVVPSTRKTSTKASKKTKSDPKLPIRELKNAHSYYLCMENRCHGKNITETAKECKNNAPKFLAQRVKKIKELARAAKIVGKFAQDLEKALSN